VSRTRGYMMLRPNTPQKLVSGICAYIYNVTSQYSLETSVENTWIYDVTSQYSLETSVGNMCIYIMLRLNTP
jgi:hypothetical protein